MTQLLALAMLFALLRYLRIRNRNRGSDLPPTYTVTPWDEFRSRVCEATGRSTVAGNPEVTQYPGGWIVWEDLAHQVTDAAMPLEEALERGPCSPGEHESPTVGDFAPVYWADSDFRVTSFANPYVGVATGDPAPDGYYLTVTFGGTTELGNAPQNSSPWLGRRVWAYGRDQGVVERVRDDGWVSCSVDPAWLSLDVAELHWDDVRAGDVQINDAFLADPVDREVIDRADHILFVASGLSGRTFNLVPTVGDRFLPASA